jgi:hypothetical protein
MLYSYQLDRTYLEFSMTPMHVGVLGRRAEESDNDEILLQHRLESSPLCMRFCTQSQLAVCHYVYCRRRCYK